MASFLESLWTVICPLLLIYGFQTLKGLRIYLRLTLQSSWAGTPQLIVRISALSPSNSLFCAQKTLNSGSELNLSLSPFFLALYRQDPIIRNALGSGNEFVSSSWGRPFLGGNVDGFFVDVNKDLEEEGWLASQPEQGWPSKSVLTDTVDVY